MSVQTWGRAELSHLPKHIVELRNGREIRRNRVYDVSGLSLGEDLYQMPLGQIAAEKIKKPTVITRTFGNIEAGERGDFFVWLDTPNCPPTTRGKAALVKQDAFAKVFDVQQKRGTSYVVSAVGFVWAVQIEVPFCFTSRLNKSQKLYYPARYILIQHVGRDNDDIPGFSAISHRQFELYAKVCV